MKKILIIAMALMLASCSVKRNVNKTVQDREIKDNSNIETVTTETITVENDTAVWTELEVVEKIKPDTVTEISVEGDNVAAKAVIKDGNITLTAISKPQQVKVPQKTTIQRKIVKKEQKDIETVTHEKEKTKVVEKKGFNLPWWVWLILLAAVLVFLFFKFKDKVL